jgi:hypothetical protein
VSDLLCGLQVDFALKDLGSLPYFLGTEVQHTVDALSKSEEIYDGSSSVYWNDGL